ncbi:MAG: DUF3817 domain-containing protein [Nocardioidaceae bacterium]
MATSTVPTSTDRVVAWFRVIAIAEAISWAGLLIGMLFKYVLSGNETGVHVFGPVHGVIFMAYVVVTCFAARRLRWTLGVLALGLVASIPPFATYAFEVWARRTGRLHTADEAAQRP